MIFVLGRREDSPCNCGPCTEARNADPAVVCNVGRYHIQGIFTEEVLACEAAQDETWFVGPLPINMALPTRTITWAGLYFPLAVRAVVYSPLGLAALFADEPVSVYLRPEGRKPRPAKQRPSTGLASLFADERNDDAGPHATATA